MGVKSISKNGIDLIKSFEGCRLTAYKAVSTEKEYTIGWGHYGVTKDTKWTQAQADAQLVKDLVKYENYVKKYCSVYEKLNQNQFDALVSFTYNCGAGSLQKLCKGRNAVQIGNTLPAYNKSGGKVLLGLTRRRNAEKTLYFTKVDTLDWSLVYNYEYYKNRYPDLSINGLKTKDDYFNHFTTYGMKEGRQACASFDVKAYKAHYEDLRKAFGENLPDYYYHYIKCGHRENRKTL